MDGKARFFRRTPDHNLNQTVKINGRLAFEECDAHHCADGHIGVVVGNRVERHLNMAGGIHVPRSEFNTVDHKHARTRLHNQPGRQVVGIRAGRNPVGCADAEGQLIQLTGDHEVISVRILLRLCVVAVEQRHAEGAAV